MSNTKLSKSRFPNSKFLIRFIIVLVTLYVGIAIGFASLIPYKYSRNHQNFLLTSTTVLLQPAMEIFADGKVTHFYDYKELPASEIPNIQGADVIPNSPQIRVFNNDYKSLLINAAADIGLTRSAAIIEPVNSQGNWSLAFCQTTKGTTELNCQVSKIKYSGQVKILVDVQSRIWGITENNNWIQLKIVEYIDRSERKDILFI